MPRKSAKNSTLNAVLLGRVTQRGDTLMIQTDLVNVADGTELWGDQFNRKVADLIAVQGDISKEIYEKLAAQNRRGGRISAGCKTRYRKSRSLPASTCKAFSTGTSGRRKDSARRPTISTGSREGP